MKTNTGRFSLKCTALKLWPSNHKQAWEKSLKAPGLFERPSSPAKWRASSIIKTRKGYGIWLDWLASASGYSASEINKSRCEDLVTQETVIAYVDYLERFCSSMTVYNRVQELYDAVVAMASHLPKAHWVWLKAAWKNLRAQATPSRNKLPRLKEADQLEALGLSLMQQAETAPERNYRQKGGLTALQRALMFRDGLMIALLIRRPFRIKNFYALSMGNNFLVHETGAVFSFKASDMKGKRSVEVPFPEGLLPYLQRYIRHYREILLTTSAKVKGKTTIDALWVSRDGTALTEGPLRVAIYKRTKAAFGASMPPHWFRDSAVTTLVRHSPGAARITGPILSHTTTDIAQKHYNQAEMIYAARRHYRVISDMMAEPDNA